MTGAPTGNRTSTRWADLRLRILSAAVLAPLALAAIWMGGPVFTAMVTLIAAGLAYEWLGLCTQRNAPAAIGLFVTLPIAVILTGSSEPEPALILLVAATIGQAILARGIPLAFGIPYLGLGAVSLVWLRQAPVNGGANVIVLLLIVWASDIGAYMTGRAIGGPRLAPAISPGKTWSGAIGGLLAAAATGMAASAFLGHGSIVLRPIVFAVLIGVISQSGDLFESHLKRHFGVKDSGNMIPGHGGLLDRLDAVLTAAPSAALLALILGPGVGLWE